MAIEIRLLQHDEGAVLHHVAPDVFDQPVDPRWSAEFFADPRHHIVVACDGPLVVGFASAVHYVHPDKPPELWINEVGVALPYQRQGLGSGLLSALLSHGASLGCVQAWVLTEPGNEPAQRLYRGVGGRAADEATVLFEIPLESGPPP